LAAVAPKLVQTRREYSPVEMLPVLVHQFTIDRNGITHTPTGWRRDSSGTITKGTDRDFDLDQVAGWAAGFG
jgi:hypothetical protein